MHLYHQQAGDQVPLPLQTALKTIREVYYESTEFYLKRQYIRRAVYRYEADAGVVWKEGRELIEALKLPAHQWTKFITNWFYQF